MQLLERDSQLAALAEYAIEASGGQGRLVLVSGEAGVGKSSLLELLEGRLDLPSGAAARWAWGACDGLFTPRPLAPLHDIAEQLGGELLALCRAGAPRDELFGALLREVSDPSALTICAIEDVHWADEATLDLLRFLGRRIRTARALLLVSYRDDGLGAGDPLRVALGELATQRSTRRLSLPPLSAGAVERLAVGTAIEPAQLYRLTGGNPFYLAEILRHGGGDLPSSARDAVLAHLAGVSPEARQVIDVAALIGARVEPGLLDEVAPASPAAVDELLSCGVLTGDGAWFRFRHEIARLAVEQAIGVHRRAPIHQGILNALQRSGCVDDARLAFHAEGAGDGDLVLRHAPSAARRASELASHRQAAAQYERALRFASNADARARAGLHDALAYELAFIDRWEDAAQAGESALTLWRQVADPLREGETLGRYARTMWRLCRGSESTAAVERSVAVLEPVGATAELARAYALLGAVRVDQGELAEAISLTRQARAMGGRLGLPDVVSDALNTEAFAMADAGRPWQGLIAEALDVAIRDGLAEQTGRAYANAYALHCSWLNFAEAEHFYVDGVAFCDEHDMATFGTCLRGERTVALTNRGRWDEALALAEQLVSSSASPVNRFNPVQSLGLVRARRGDDGVWKCLDELAASAEGLEEPPYVVRAGLARAEGHWLEGDLDAARQEIARAEAAAELCNLRQRSEVAAWRRRVGGTAHDVVDGGSTAPDQLLEPYASQVAGDWAGAARQWDGLGCAYDAALALLDATDEPLLRDALARLERLGARATARLARQRMRDLGVKSVPSGARATTRAHPAGLTRREREVLELVCAGQTNEEIAGKLFISVKTVDHHVSAVLGKLGVGSRKVAASEAVRLGLVSMDLSNGSVDLSVDLTAEVGAQT